MLFGAVLVAEGGPVEVGANCIVMENVVVRGTARHPTRVGDHVLIRPHANLTGCTVEDDVFIATGASIFNGARIGARSLVAINGVVHLKTFLPPDSRVPIGWTAAGDPVEILPPNEDERRKEITDQLDFPLTVFGVERAPEGETRIPEITRRYSRALGKHREDEVLDP